MKQTRLLMGMPITVEITDKSAYANNINAVFDYFTYVDTTFSTYKENSEISQINNGKITEKNYSKEMKEVLFLAGQTESDTKGYFNIHRNGKIDPSGIVKGWAIYQAHTLLKKMGFENFYIDAGGDIQVSGKKSKNENWKVGIRNPFHTTQIIKALQIYEKGVATSGTYVRGQHVYDPFNPEKELADIVSITIVGPNVYEADRFATAAFAMQEKGVAFIQTLPGFEAYAIDKNGIATFTSGFEKYTI